jgi:hypothetical protein
METDATMRAGAATSGIPISNYKKYSHKISDPRILTKTRTILYYTLTNVCISYHIISYIDDGTIVIFLGWWVVVVVAVPWL